MPIFTIIFGNIVFYGILMHLNSFDQIIFVKKIFLQNYLRKKFFVQNYLRKKFFLQNYIWKNLSFMPIFTIIFGIIVFYGILMHLNSFDQIIFVKIFFCKIYNDKIFFFKIMFGKIYHLCLYSQLSSESLFYGILMHLNSFDQINFVKIFFAKFS